MGQRHDDFDAEIRGHLALSIKERIERGEDPEQARLAALREFGNVTLTRESLRDVWRPHWLVWLGPLWQDLRIAGRSLARAKGLSAAVIVTLALGIGANAAIFSVVRQVLLTPLVNRDEARLIYIRQSAPGLGSDNVHFSVPEIKDFAASAKTIATFADFSTIDFNLVGLGTPRVIKGGVVSGSFFDVMGLKPVEGRLLCADDDGPDAASVTVLTHRFWTTALRSDPNVVGRKIRLGTIETTIVGVLEPAVPYPQDTEIISNIVTSPHHLSATMVTSRTHRMTELFGRLAPGATVEQARDEIARLHLAMVRDNPAAYSPAAGTQVSVTTLRDRITSPARPVLLVLLGAAAIVFAIACSNVTNLILARSVRRERELQVRAALGASAGALRRTLLAESIVLCGAGALLGIVLARPFVTLVSAYAARFSVRAIGVGVDASILWTGAALAIAAAVVLAFVPKLPATRVPGVAAPAVPAVRVTPGANRRLRAFAVTQIALSFVLLTGAGLLVATLMSLERAATGFDMHQVLAVDVALPIEAYGNLSTTFFDRTMARVAKLPGVQHVSAGNFVPWRDANAFGPGFRFAIEGQPPTQEDAHGRLRIASPGFFAALGIPILAGREFSDGDRRGAEPVVIVSHTLATRLFPDGNAVGRHLWWTDPYFGKPVPRRIVGIAADADDEHVTPEPAVNIYHPFNQFPFANRLFVQASGDPYALVPDIRRIINELSAEQPVERPATLGDIRAEVLRPQRMNAFVVSGFAGIALLIAVVGVAGVLAFSVNARTREFGVRLAIGSSRSRLMLGVLREGASMIGVGMAIGAALGAAFAFAAAGILNTATPGIAPMAFAALLLAAAALGAALLPAARASRVNVMQALGPE